MSGTAKKNKVTYGLEKCHYAKGTLNEETGEITYEEPVKLPGAVEMTVEPTGDQITFKADNIDYYKAPNNQGYEGTLNLALIPDKFLQEILGEVENVEAGMISEYSNAKTSPFALLFEFSGDQTETRHALYYCSATRPTVASSTKDSGEPNTQELAFSSSPRPADKLVKSRTNGDVTTTQYNAWFEAVQEPPVETETEGA
ncbi:MAG: major tail protein [Lachnospiraceae bacterium]